MVTNIGNCRNKKGFLGCSYFLEYHCFQSAIGSKFFFKQGGKKASWGTSIPVCLIIDIMHYLALTRSLIEIPQSMDQLEFCVQNSTCHWVTMNGGWPMGWIFLLMCMLHCPIQPHLPNTSSKITLLRISRQWQKIIKWSPSEHRAPCKGPGCVPTK